MSTSEIPNSCASFLYPYGEEPGSSKKSTNFGIYQFTVPQDPPKFKHMHWIITIDRSASMMDICGDGKTKIEHLKHTLRNMLDYFAKLCEVTPTLNQYLTIIMFDHDVETVCSELKINNEVVNTKISEILYKIFPRGSTNIEKALEEAQNIIGDITSQESYDDTHQTGHIFMSDGNITTGSTNIIELKEKLNILPSPTKDHLATNTFIGYGSGHDAELMRTLSDIPKGQYYFIDTIENAGMVYGEVLYNSLYEYMKNIKITVKSGEIYDYKEDAWKQTLDVVALSSGQTRTWHIRKVTCREKQEKQDNSSSSSQLSSEPEFVEIPTTVTLMGDIHGVAASYTTSTTATYPDVLDKKVEKYLWRQKTQQIMKKVENFVKKEEDASPTQTAFALYPGAIHKPLLHRNYTHTDLTASAAQPPPPPPSSPLTPTLPVLHYPEPDKRFLCEQHEILDMAKHQAWKTVWDSLDKMQHLVNSFPSPRRFNLVHHAIHQERVDVLEKLLEQGANPFVKTADGLSTTELAQKSSKIIRDTVETLLRKYSPSSETNKKSHQTTLSLPIPVPTRKTKEDYIRELDEFMIELKHYISENNLENDNFMQNLCDDIYVCTKSLTASKNTREMYLGTRSSSQGNERAYNISNFNDLNNESQPIHPTFRGLSSHQTSEQTQTSYASRGAANLMRAVSTGL